MIQIRVQTIALDAYLEPGEGSVGQGRLWDPHLVLLLVKDGGMVV